MIRIKEVDAQNILDVCELTASQDSIGRTAEGCSHCNAISIAEAKYDPEMHPNAIYSNHSLIGFLCISARRITRKRQRSAALWSMTGFRRKGSRKKLWSTSCGD